MKNRLLGPLLAVLATVAAMGKPATEITVGVSVKNCDECERGDCSACAYKKELERLMDTRTCHDCDISKVCGVRPALGRTIRINCPLWQPKGKQEGCGNE